MPQDSGWRKPHPEMRPWSHGPRSTQSWASILRTRANQACMRCDKGGLRLLARDALVVGPAKFARLARDPPRVGAGGLRFEDRAKLRDQRGTFHQHALLAVEPGRARIEVVAADEQGFLVDRQRLGVQAGAGRAEQARVRLLTRERLQLPELHAALEQLLAVARVAAVHRRDIVGGERVREDSDLAAARARCSRVPCCLCRPERSTAK